MIVRHAIVRGADATRVELEPDGACDGCACAGRCALGGSRRIALPRSCFAHAPVAGERLRLSIDESMLRRAAIALYGRLLAGLLLGAAAGAGLASLGRDPIEWLVVVGAAAGTLVGLWRSQQVFRALVPRIEFPTSGEASRP